jgi:mono/diheme cytochrome c family protein
LVPLRLTLGVVLGFPLPAQTPLPRGVSELRQVYRDNCSRCHGLDGSGRDAGGRRLAGLDFTSSAKVKHLREEEQVGPGTSLREMRSMARTIRKGIFFGRVMPAWRDLLTEEEAVLMLREVIMKAERGRPIEP